MLNTRHLSEKSKEIELQKDPQRKTLIIGSNNRRLAVGNEVADRIQV